PRRLHPSLHHVISIHVSISPHVASPPTRSRPRRPPRPAHIHRRVLVHTPRQTITILRPKPSPRAGPTPFLRASGSSVIASSTPPHIAHDPRTSPHLLSGDSMPIHATMCLRNVFTYCRHSPQLPCRILSLLNSHFICIVVSNFFFSYFGPSFEL
ncbi:hypothetical protein B0H14DRAFT_2933957, partial [Mycena olivaceomarginata]